MRLPGRFLQVCSGGAIAGVWLLLRDTLSFPLGVFVLVGAAAMLVSVAALVIARRPVQQNKDPLDRHLQRRLDDLKASQVGIAEAQDAQCPRDLVTPPPRAVVGSPGQAGGHPCQTHAYRVLVVDDSVDIVESTAFVLRLWGHEVRMAQDGMAALAVAGEFKPEVVLLDIGLPGITGWEVAKRLRQ